MTDDEDLVRLEEAIRQGHETIKDLNAAVDRAKEEIRTLAKQSAQRHLASALETAAGSLRSALKGKT